MKLGSVGGKLFLTMTAFRRSDASKVVTSLVEVRAVGDSASDSRDSIESLSDRVKLAYFKPAAKTSGTISCKIDIANRQFTAKAKNERTAQSWYSRVSSSKPKAVPMLSLK